MAFAFNGTSRGSRGEMWSDADSDNYSNPPAHARATSVKNTILYVLRIYCSLELIYDYSQSNYLCVSRNGFRSRLCHVSPIFTTICNPIVVTTKNRQNIFFSIFANLLGCNFFVVRSKLTVTMSRTWTYGICSCCGDCSVCIPAFLCTSCVIGKNAEAVGENCFLFTLSQQVPVLKLFTRAYIRKRIREEKQIEGTFWNDLKVHCLWARCCSGVLPIIQETRELKNPGGQDMARE